MEEYMIGIVEAVEEGIMSLNFATSGLGVLVYVLQALALYTIAERRAIKKPWLAWIPVVNVWILGSVSDQYQYVVKGQVKNKRKVLLGINIAIAVIVSIILAAVIGLVVELMLIAFDMPNYTDVTEMLVSNLMYYFGSNIVLLALLSILVISLTVLSVMQTVYFYMALYDVFRSCDPKNSTLYIVLSLVGNFMVEGVYCIFMMLCKDKDLGMPPRKVVPEVVIPEETAEEPTEEVPVEAPENTEE